jgi:hypothetical protein
MNNFVAPETDYRATAEILRVPHHRQGLGPPDAFSQVRAYPPPISYYGGEPSQDTRVTSVWGTVVVSANVLFAGIVFAGMYWNGHTALASIAISAVYYATTTLTALAFITGQARYLWDTFIHFLLERKRLNALWDLAAGDQELQIERERTRQLELKVFAVGSQQPVLAIRNNVSSQSVTPNTAKTPLSRVAREGLRWMRKLYDARGEIDAREVCNDGRLRKATIGGAKAGGSKEARQWLESHQMIQAISGGHALNVEQFHSWESVVLFVRTHYAS